MTFFGAEVPNWAAELVMHNWPVMLFSLGTAVAAVAAYLRPSRSTVLLLYGFLMLTAGFEYEKHGLRPVGGVFESLFEGSAQGRSLARSVAIGVLPPVMYAAGVVLLASSATMALRRRASTPTKNHG